MDLEGAERCMPRCPKCIDVSNLEREGFQRWQCNGCNYIGDACYYCWKIAQTVTMIQHNDDLIRVCIDCFPIVQEKLKKL